MQSRLELILADTSRALADIAISEVEQNPELYEEAWDLVLRDEYPISMRAVRIVDECAEKNPLLILPYIDEILQELPEFKVTGVKRGLLRFFVNSKMRLSLRQKAFLVELCFKFLCAADSSTSIRYYALSILYKLSKKEPYIKVELLSAIEEGILRNRFTHNSSLQKIRKKLQREIESGYST